MANLTDIIRSEIERHGPITFEQYMQLALYHPTLGYYRSARDPFGRSGDFFTAAQLQPVFGETIRAFVARCTAVTTCPEPWEILDLGAGRAELGPALANAYPYRAIEIGDNLPDEVRSGIVIANEFFDALPVRRVCRSANGEWTELLVRWSNQGFKFIQSEDELAPKLQSYLEMFGDTIPVGGSTEINLAMDVWLAKLAQILHCGSVLVIDYGYEERELLRLGDGTSISYHKHSASPAVLATPGMRDITSHVNFSWLKHLAVLHGFRVMESCFLSEFVARLWATDALQQRLGNADAHFKAQWKQLVVGMGETFRVVVLSK